LAVAACLALLAGGAGACGGTASPVVSAANAASGTSAGGHHPTSARTGDLGRAQGTPSVDSGRSDRPGASGGHVTVGAPPAATSSGSTSGSAADRSGGSRSGSATSGAIGTRQVIYTPFSGTAPAPGLSVTLHQSGPCYVYGGGVDGRQFYRCFGQQQVDGHTFIWDPCFAGPDGTAAPLLCPDGPPTSSSLVAFTVTAISGTAPAATQRVPWAMQLANGQVCEIVAAAWGGLGPFSCQSLGSSASGAAGSAGTAGSLGATATSGSAGSSSAGSTGNAGTSPAGTSPAETSPSDSSTANASGGSSGVPAAGAVADCHTPVAGQPWWTAACQSDATTASPFVAQRVVTVWF